MTKNQNDPRNQDSDSKSHQEQTQDGKKKEELNPNNPKASQNSKLSTPQGNLQRKDSTKGESNTDVQEEDEEETTDSSTFGKPVSQIKKK